MVKGAVLTAARVAHEAVEAYGLWAPCPGVDLVMDGDVYVGAGFMPGLELFPP